MTSCSFTGHRIINITPQLKNELENQLVKLINTGITNFYAGGALGWDMLCEQMILRLKETYSQIELHLILPCPFEEQTLKWSSNDKAQFSSILNKAYNVEIISPNYTSTCMKKRNQSLIDHSDLILCYYNPKSYRSGTGQTVRMAEKNNKQIINLYSQQ